MIEVEREETAVEQRGEWKHQKWRWFVRGRPQIGGISRQPLLDACRSLKRAGADTDEEIRLFRPGRTDWDLKTTVGYGAGITVEDADDRGPQFIKYREYPK